MINFVQRKRENEQQRAGGKAIGWALLQGSLLTPHDRIHAQQLISCCLLSETPVGSFHLPGCGNTWANAGSRGMLVWKKPPKRPYLLIFLSYKGPPLWPTSLQNQYSSRISAKAEPCALIHVSFVPQHLPPVSSRQTVSGNNDDDGDEEGAVCLHLRGPNRCLQQAQQKDNWEEAFRWFGEGELQVLQPSTELWWHEFMCTPSTACTILWRASHPSTMKINQLFIPVRLDRRRQNGGRSKHTNSTRQEGLYTL